MKATISKTPIGLVVFDEKGKLIDKVLFPKDPKKIVDAIEDDKKYRELLTESLKKKGYKQIEESNEPGRIKFRKIAKDIGYSEVQLNSLLADIGVEFTRRKIKKTVKKDKIIIQTISAIDELDKSINIFVARLREWYSLHYPELEREIDKHEKFVKLISEYGLRENIPDAKLGKITKESMGIELEEKDEELLKEYSTQLKELYKLREHLEKYTEKLMEEVAPNFSAIATPLLGARLIALEGSLSKLAKKPSSTLQLMGAEKALFRYLKGHGKSPKYGILYTHPEIQKVPMNKRGRIARILASKMAIAIKVDQYGSKDRTEKLKKEVDEKIKEALED
jgi:nucleolar protein 56